MDLRPIHQLPVWQPINSREIGVCRKDAANFCEVCGFAIGEQLLVYIGPSYDKGIVWCDGQQAFQVCYRPGPVHRELTVMGQDDVVPLLQRAAAREGGQRFPPYDDGMSLGELGETLPVFFYADRLSPVFPNSKAAVDEYDEIHKIPPFRLYQLP